MSRKLIIVIKHSPAVEGQERAKRIWAGIVLRRLGKGALKASEKDLKRFLKAS